MGALRDLGLSDYEARTYQGLLEQGQATAQETVEATGVPEGRIYDVLNSLTKYGLVHSGDTRHPKTYIPVEPAIALNRLLEVKEAQLETTRRRYETLVSDMAEEFATIDPVTRSCEMATVCLEESSSLLTDQVASATQEVLLTIAPSTLEPCDSDATLVEALSEAAQNGVDISVLAHPDQTLSTAEHEQLRAVDLDAFDIRVCEQVTTTVACLDGQTLVMEGPTTFQQPPGFLLINAGRANITDQFRIPFIQHWERAQTAPTEPPKAAE